jgi:hypothetical protein
MIELKGSHTYYGNLKCVSQKTKIVCGGGRD